MRQRGKHRTVGYIHAEALHTDRGGPPLPTVAEWEDALAGETNEPDEQGLAADDDGVAEVEVEVAAAFAAITNASPEDAWPTAAKPLVVTNQVSPGKGRN